MSRPDGPAENAPGNAEIDGLRVPRGPILPALEWPRRLSPGRTGLQVAGFLLGLGLLGYSVKLALATPESREGLARLAEARAKDAATLLALAALSVGLNGLAFWTMLAPQRRLRVVDVVAVNAISTALSYLPFKISALARVFIHRRRDHLPFRLIISWFASLGVVSLGAIGLLGLVAVWQGGLTWTAGALSLAALVVYGAACVIGGRIASASPRLDALSLGAGRLLRSAPAVAGVIGLRIVDLGAQTGRFLVAAALLGHDVSVADATLLAATYFLTGVVSVAGSLGVREGAVIGVGALSVGGGLGAGEFASIALVVTAAEAAAQIALTPCALLWLRPDRLLRRAPERGVA